jgi:hypothetical protein
MAMPSAGDQTPREGAEDHWMNTTLAPPRALPTLPGFRARLALEEDGPALAEVERNTPIVLGDRSIRIDRGADYFAASRLMVRPVVALGEVHGQVVCVFAGAVLPVRVAGDEKHLMLAHHARVLPAFQHHGLWRAASRLVYEVLSSEVEGSISYVATTNRAAQHLTANSRKWSFPILRALLDTHAVGGAVAPVAARAMRDDDAVEVTRILNTCHAHEEGYVPYTPAGFRARLARAPAQYGHPHVWRFGHAVLGVWPAGGCIAEIHEWGTERRTHRQGRALDYGFLPGCDADFAALLGAWCRHLEDMGQDQLAIFTNEGSPGYATIVERATDVETFNLCLAIAEPPDAALRGWWVDAACF